MMQDPATQYCDQCHCDHCVCGDNGASGSIRDSIMTVMRTAGRPLSSPEIAERLGVPVEVARPRISELMRDGLLEDSGTRSRTSEGRPLRNWKIKT